MVRIDFEQITHLLLLSTTFLCVSLIPFYNACRKGFRAKENITSPVIGAAYTMTSKRESLLIRANNGAKQRDRNVCRFEAAAWGREALHDSGPSGCE